MSVDELLSGVGLRRTRARRTVLELLRESGRPLSHLEIAEQTGAQQLDRVTVYRTLSALERAGLVDRVQGMDRTWRFCFHADEQEGCPGSHPHFLCLSCDEMSCLPGPPIPWIAVPNGAAVVGKQLMVYGTCQSCSESGATSQPETPHD